MIASLVVALGLAAAPSPVLIEGIGPHTRAFTSSTPEAQRWFDQGLALLFAFNHDEARRSFLEAARLAPRAAMPWWGVAMTDGPHVNNPSVPEERAKDALDALAKAGALDANDVEKALIAAQKARYALPAPEDRRRLDEAYASAMRDAWKRFPTDADVGALFAEAVMDLSPWNQWARDGKANPGTDEILATLDAVTKLEPNHPLALHLVIHALEASPRPEKAKDAADRLRDLAPGLGHLVHMPSHIDVRTGRYDLAVKANQKAIEVDKAYWKERPREGFYLQYTVHNFHMLAFAAMMRGQSAVALRAVDDLVKAIPPEILKAQAGNVDGNLALPLETMMRFGRWDEILKLKDFDAAFPFARAMRRAARGVAYAAKGKPKEARAEQAAFLEEKANVAPDAQFGLSRSLDLLMIASRLLEGEVSLAEGRMDEGIAALREAVAFEDALPYDEPPDWNQPVRHALGAALLKAKRASDAEQVFRDDLVKNPDNGWSLYGLGRALRLQKRDDEAKAVEARFRDVWKDADFTLSSSCLCLPHV